MGEHGTATVEPERDSNVDLRTLRQAIAQHGLYRAQSGKRTIAEETLRHLVLGTNPPESSGNRAINTVRDLAGIIMRDRQPAPLPGPVIIDGGDDLAVTLEGPGKVVSLAKVCADNGEPLRALVLRNLNIGGTLDLSDAHFASIEIDNCRFKVIRADGLRVDGDVVIRDARPICVAEKPSKIVGAPPAETPPEGECRIRMVSAQIRGGLVIRGARLHAPLIKGDDPYAELGANEYSNQFALSLATAIIGGRVFIGNNVEAWGGISLFQASVGGSVTLDISRLCAGRTDEPDPYDVHNKAILGRRNYAALDAQQVEVDGSFLLMGPSAPATLPKWNINGRVLLLRARIDGDLYFRQCRWAADHHVPSGMRINGNGLVGCGRYATGGIDARYIRLNGQFRIDGRSTIGRRHIVNSGQRHFAAIGSAVDLWKSEIKLGLSIHPNVTLIGALNCNDSIIGRYVRFAGRVFLPATIAAKNCPYHMAVDFTGTTINGHVGIWSKRITGRVSLMAVQINGSLDIGRLAFSYRRSTEPNYSDIDKAFTGNVLDEHRKPLEQSQWELLSHSWKSKDWRAASFDETSILDMQDLHVTGGVNLKREAISIAAGSVIPLNKFIVDLRGMRCETWDDADATCWSGMHLRDVHMRTPWRIRFDGISFNRLDSSAQHQLLDHRATRRVWQHAGVVIRAIFALISTTIPAIIDDFLDRRSMMTVGSDELKRFRFNSLRSFHSFRRDKYDWHNGTLTIDSMSEPLHKRTTILSELRSACWHWLSENGLPQVYSRSRRWLIPGRFIALWRWTFQRSWRRREEIPPFSPQPYEAFARAYVQRGEVDVGIWLARKKLKYHWRRRARSFSLAWGLLWLPTLITCFCLLRSWPWPVETIADQLLIIAVIAFIVPPLGILSSIYVFGACFGHGLSTGRSIATMISFVLSVAIFTPAFVDPNSSGRAFGLKTAWSGEANLNRMYYGIDKLMPTELFNLGARLYPDGVIKHKEDNDKKTSEKQKRYDSGADPIQEPAFSLPPQHPTRYYLIDKILDLLGAVIISLSAVTWSGLLRRDLERGH